MKLTPQHRLILFIALSLAIHLVLLRVDTSLEEVTQQEQGGSWLQLQLQQKIADVSPEQFMEESIPGINPEVKHQTQLQENELTATPQDIASQGQPVEIATTETATPNPTKDKPVISAPNVVKVNRIIADEFTHNFYYPATARRRNWQGDVVLQFTLMPDGSIVHIRINKSSGYRVLDEAAMDVMSKIKAEQQLALVLNGNSLDHLLPVSYRLQDAL